MSCLNKSIWADDNSLRDDIREVLLKVASDVKKDLSEELQFDLPIEQVVLVGSLTGPNYDDMSDFDVHFIYDPEKCVEETDKHLLKEFLAFFMKNFNQKDYDLLGYHLEIYFQTVDEINESPGIYDIEANRWIKNPDCIVVEPDKNVLTASEKYKKQIDDLDADYRAGKYTNKDAFLQNLKDFYQSIRDFRKLGMSSPDGMYSFENLVFKLLRRNGAMEKLVELMRLVKDDIYEVPRLETVECIIEKLLETRESGDAFNTRRAISISKLEEALNKGKSKYGWITRSDEKTCDECGPRHNQTYDIEDGLSGDELITPAHPNCRCIMVMK